MSYTPSMRYLKWSLFGVAGIAIASLPQIIAVPDAINQSKITSRFQTEQNIEREYIKEQALTSEYQRKYEIASPSKQLFIDNYLYNRVRPPSISTRVSRARSDEAVTVYDKSGYCIGMIQQRKFIFKGNKVNICKGIDQVTR